MYIKKTDRDRIQITMFNSVYKVNVDLTPEERLARAIVLSSDEFVDKTLKNHPREVKDYLRWIDENEAHKVNAKRNKGKWESHERKPRP